MWRFVRSGVLVLDLQVALKDLLGPQHHMVSVVLQFGTGSQLHALIAVLDRADLSIEKPTLRPVFKTCICKDFLPLHTIGLFECRLFGGTGIRHAWIGHDRER